MEKQSPSVHVSGRPGGDAGAESLPATAAGNATLPPQAIRPFTVLLVDDDALISMASTELLKDLGYQVFEAHSGTSALEILRGGIAVDLVITDQAMPGMTGTELAAEIRALWPDLPIILATGHADLPKGGPLELQRLDKPYGEKDLAAAIAGVARIGTA